MFEVKWTGDKDKRLKQMWSGGGHNLTDIARELGATRAAIDCRARRLNLPPLGAFNMWTAARTQELCRLYYIEGMTAAQIARMWGVTSHTIKGKISRINERRKLANPEAPISEYRGDRKAYPLRDRKLHIPENDRRSLDRFLEKEPASDAKRYEALLDAYSEYADDVFEAHGYGPHYRDAPEARYERD